MCKVMESSFAAKEFRGGAYFVPYFEEELQEIRFVDAETGENWTSPKPVRPTIFELRDQLTLLLLLSQCQLQKQQIRKMMQQQMFQMLILPKTSLLFLLQRLKTPFFFIFSFFFFNFVLRLYGMKLSFLSMCIVLNFPSFICLYCVKQ